MEPVVHFKKIVPFGRTPERASRDANGTLPPRALKWCEVVTTASSFGWHVYPPIRFGLALVGDTVFWSYRDNPELLKPEWHVLDKSTYYPNFNDLFDDAAPDDVKGFWPTFLLRTVTGMVQIWTGLIVRTAPEWSILLRAPANIIKRGYHHLDGIIETDWWGSFLFFNIRLLDNGPIWFDPSEPFLQIQPLPREIYGNKFLDTAASFEDGIDKLTADDWQAYHDTVVIPNSDPNRRMGRYAAVIRRRRKREG